MVLMLTNFNRRKRREQRRFGFSVTSVCFCSVLVFIGLDFESGLVAVLLLRLGRFLERLVVEMTAKDVEVIAVVKSAHARRLPKEDGGCNSPHVPVRYDGKLI